MPVHVQHNLAYGDGPRGGFDLYTPGPDPTDTFVVFFYGGSWRRGSKARYGFVGRCLARMGYTVAIPDYRVYPEVTFPGFVEDGARAVQHLAATYRPRRLVVMGHSAGGHIAATLALDGARYFRSLPDPQPKIAGLIGLAGGYSPKSWKPNLVFGSAPTKLWNPVDLATPAAPPALLLHGRRDITVEPGQTKALAAALEAAGAPAEVHFYPFMGHMRMLLPFVPGFGYYTSLRRDIQQFITNLK